LSRRAGPTVSFVWVRTEAYQCWRRPPGQRGHPTRPDIRVPFTLAKRIGHQLDPQVWRHIECAAANSGPL